MAPNLRRGFKFNFKKTIAMDSNPLVLAVIGIVLIVLVAFLIIRNKKDRKQLENQLNQDFRKTKDADHTTDPDDIKST